MSSTTRKGSYKAKEWNENRVSLGFGRQTVELFLDRTKRNISFRNLHKDYPIRKAQTLRTFLTSKGIQVYLEWVQATTGQYYYYSLEALLQFSHQCILDVTKLRNGQPIGHVLSPSLPSPSTKERKKRSTTTQLRFYLWSYPQQKTHSIASNYFNMGLALCENVLFSSSTVHHPLSLFNSCPPTQRFFLTQNTGKSKPLNCPALNSLPPPNEEGEHSAAPE